VKFLQHRAGIRHDPGCPWTVVAAQHGRVDIDLDHMGQRHSPSGGRDGVEAVAHCENQIGVGHDPAGQPSAHPTQRAEDEGVRGGHGADAVERRDDRYPQ